MSRDDVDSRFTEAQRCLLEGDHAGLVRLLEEEPALEQMGVLSIRNAALRAPKSTQEQRPS